VASVARLAAKDLAPVTEQPANGADEPAPEDGALAAAGSGANGSQAAELDGA
jgi:hypothetical protein